MYVNVCWKKVCFRRTAFNPPKEFPTLGKSVSRSTEAVLRLTEKLSSKDQLASLYTICAEACNIVFTALLMFKVFQKHGKLDLPTSYTESRMCRDGINCEFTLCSGWMHVLCRYSFFSDGCNQLRFHFPTCKVELLFTKVKGYSSDSVLFTVLQADVKGGRGILTYTS